MRINPVLKNESKLGVRTWKFPLMVLVYTTIIAAIAILLFWGSTKNAYFFGLNLNESLKLYLLIAVVQSVLLLFMVPSMSSSAISSEREKQTLDVLLSTKMSSLSIIIGKLFSSVSKVILLIFLTLPIYGLSFLIGGVALQNVLELAVFFIITTFFVGAIGIFYSTFLKSTKGATAATYGTVLFIFLGIVIAGYIVFIINMNNHTADKIIEFPNFVSVSPLAGLVSLLTNQVGMANLTVGPLNIFYPMITMSGFSNVVYYSMGGMFISTIILVYISSIKLNPLNRRKIKSK